MTRITRSVEEAVEVLRQGDPVAIPTETVYGLAANAFDERAIAKVFAAKERPSFDPLIVHLAIDSDAWQDGSLTDLSRFTALARQRLEALAQAFWPGPLTIVLPKTARVPDLVTSGLPRVALRKPAHPVAQRVLALTGFPLAAPSANRFGRISPTESSHVMAELEGRIPLILDGGPCSVGVESTVIAIAEDGRISILRPGGLAPEKITDLLGCKLEPAAQAKDLSASPGTLESHYAPTKPLLLLDSESAAKPDLRSKRAGLLTLAPASREWIASWGPNAPTAWTFHPLSSNGDPHEAARELFRGLRELDASDCDVMVSVLPTTPWTGLIHAIADRLQRASKRY